MSSQVSQISAFPQRPAEEPYIPVEEIAQRLDLPLTILLRRIEAGDVPARRLIGGGRSGWGIRLSDLGIEADAGTSRGPRDDEPRLDASDGAPPPPAAAGEPPAAVAHAEDAPAPEAAAPEAEVSEAVEPEPGDRERPAPELGAAVARERSDEPVPDSSEPMAMLAGRITRYERGTRGPRGEVAGMFIDSRELVTGLLDRWERTLEQRIFIEQRQRFEGELNARQNLVKQLQLELQTARAEHAAYVADSERRRAELERQIDDLQRELSTAADPYTRRRSGLFHRR